MPNTVAEGKAAGWLHVVAAVIWRDCVGQPGQILLAKRPVGKHQGGKWEFPGGKVEKGEMATHALVRELLEELGIKAAPARLTPFVQVHHRYPDKSVFLDVWELRDFTGIPQGREGQDIGWFTLNELATLPFPAANLPILNALTAAL